VTATSSSGRLYDVTFYGSGPCGAYLSEWGVKLGNWTLTEPSNVTLSEIPENGGWAASSSLRNIVFAVPSGVYSFTLYPFAVLHVGSSNGTTIGGSSGTVIVTNSDVIIYTAFVGICR